MTLVHNFDEVVDRHGTNSSKWLKYPADVLPMWVADSDFKCPQPVVDEINKIAQSGVYGYPYVLEGSLEKATVGWVKRRFGWEIKEEQIDYVPCLGTALAVAVKAFAQPGDKVLMQSPIYPPFTYVTEKNLATPSYNSLILKDGKISIDFEDFERRAADPKCKLFLLCNPHNPTGRVFSREELEKMVDICARNNVVIFSDEVHADFVYPGKKHIVLPMLNETANRISMVGLNPSKTFNVAGVRTSTVVNPNPELQAAYQKALASCKLGRNIFGVAAYVKCYTECDYYADQVNEYIRGNLEYAVDFITRNVPKLKVYMPDATYLLWIDCRALPFKNQAELDKFFVEEVKLGLNPGRSFGVEGEGFLRMNMACPRSYVEEAMRRIDRVVNAL